MVNLRDRRPAILPLAGPLALVLSSFPSAESVQEESVQEESVQEESVR